MPIARATSASRIIFRPVSEVLRNLRLPGNSGKLGRRWRARRVALGPLAVRVQFALLRRWVSDRAPRRRLRWPARCVRLPRPNPRAAVTDRREHGLPSRETVTEMGFPAPNFIALVSRFASTCSKIRDRIPFTLHRLRGRNLDGAPCPRQSTSKRWTASRTSSRDRTARPSRRSARPRGASRSRRIAICADSRLPCRNNIERSRVDCGAPSCSRGSCSRNCSDNRREVIGVFSSCDATDRNSSRRRIAFCDAANMTAWSTAVAAWCAICEASSCAASSNAGSSSSAP